MSGWVKAGKAAWGAIKGVKPGIKFKGQSTVEAIKKKGMTKLIIPIAANQYQSFEKASILIFFI